MLGEEKKGNCPLPPEPSSKRASQKAIFRQFRYHAAIHRVTKLFILLILLIGLALPVGGFWPLNDTVNTGINSGVGFTHERITEQAVEQLDRLLYGDFDAGMQEALRQIIVADSEVDLDQQNGYKHFDGESFQRGQDEIVGPGKLRDQLIAAMKAPQPNAVEARKILGHILHPLQDFYTHSNWIEMGNRDLQPELGIPGMPISNFAGVTENTCEECTAFHREDGYWPLLFGLSHLTSGYFGGEHENPSPGVTKAHHGNPFDSSLPFPNTAYLNCGLSKDATRGNPHSSLHLIAAGLAVHATTNFVGALRGPNALTDDQFALLLGVEGLRYKIRIIAKTGDAAGTYGLFTGFDPNVSINDDGDVAFVGLVGSKRQQALFVKDASGRTLLNPFPPSTRAYSTPQINNAGSVVVYERVSPPLQMLIRVWKSNVDQIIVARGSTDSSFNYKYAAVYPYPSINSAGTVAFYGDTPGFLFSKPILTTSISQPLSLPGTLLPPRPKVVDDNSVLLGPTDYSPDIIRLAPDLKTFDKVVDHTLFDIIQNSVSATDDGNLIVFHGSVTDPNAINSGRPDSLAKMEKGEGVFAVVQGTAGHKFVQRLSGKSENGILEPGEAWGKQNNAQKDFGLVTDYPLLPKTAAGDGVVAFDANTKSVNGHQAYGIVATQWAFDPATTRFTNTPPVPVILTGDELYIDANGDGLRQSPERGLGKVLFVSYSQKVNGKGQIALRVYTETGQDAICVAEPIQLIRRIPLARRALAKQAATAAEPAPAIVHLLQILADGSTPTDKEYPFLVDDKLSSLNIRTYGSVSTVLIDPNGKTNAPSAQFPSDSITEFNVPAPSVGTWKLHATAPIGYLITVDGLGSPMVKQFDYVEPKGRPGHQGYYPMSTLPSLDGPTIVRILMEEPSTGLKLQSCLPDTTPLSMTPMVQGYDATNSFIATDVVITNNYSIYLFGTNSARMPFQRLISGGEAAGSATLQVTERPDVLFANTPSQFVINCRNATAAAGDYSIQVTNTRSFPIDWSPRDFHLEPGFDTNILITLNVGTSAEIGSSDVLNVTLVDPATTNQLATLAIPALILDSTQATTARLSIEQESAGTLVVKWDVPGTLETTTNLSGPWEQIPDALSPYPVTGSALPRFYRLRLK